SVCRVVRGKSGTDSRRTWSRHVLVGVGGHEDECEGAGIRAAEVLEFGRAGVPCGSAGVLVAVRVGGVAHERPRLGTVVGVSVAPSLLVSLGPNGLVGHGVSSLIACISMPGLSLYLLRACQVVMRASSLMRPLVVM